MAIPSEFKGTLYVYWCLSGEYLTFHKHDWASKDDDYVLLHKHTLSLAFNVEEATGHAVGKLNEAIKREQATSVMRCNAIRETIQSMLALEAS